MKEKMMHWTEANEKVEGTNKLREIKKHLDKIKPPQEHQNPYGMSKAYLNTIHPRAVTSPVGMGPEVAELMKESEFSRARSLMKTRGADHHHLAPLTGIRAQSLKRGTSRSGYLA